MTRTLVLSLLIGAIAGIVLGVASAASLQRSVLAVGGGEVAGMGMKIKSTVGLPIVGPATGTSHGGSGGFWPNEPMVVSVEPEAVIPSVHRLRGVYPNPFNPRARVTFDVSEVSGFVRVEVYDTVGRLVRRLYEGVPQPGRHEIVWDGRDDGRRQLASGSYFVRMRASRYAATHRVMLVR